MEGVLTYGQGGWEEVEIDECEENRLYSHPQLMNHDGGKWKHLLTTVLMLRLDYAILTQ